ncbi:MAG TPA: adenylate/guanylate cyclase domain-containing protein [Dongiaceae bacterium]|nr:adenylate/guanylate cyclase domain-containing protein [Dongiaceae bacterium]
MRAQPLSIPQASGAHERAILDWLMRGTHCRPSIEDIFAELCKKLLGAGLPIAKASLHFRVQHPQWVGTRIIWNRGGSAAELQTVGYHVEETPEFLDSPLRDITLGADLIRQRLDALELGSHHYQFFTDLKAAGLSDYIALPLDHTLGKRHLVSFASDATAGFDDGHIDLLANILPALALVSEIRIKNQLARTLLETYVGPHASEQILEGATTRGSGATVGAAIILCDLRNFTALSHTRPRDLVIDLLNGYFDAVTGPIEKYGGEILKFMGDGLLAVFPLSEVLACSNLLRAICEARAAIDRLNETVQSSGLDPLEYGMGVHVGDVMYGNIGSRSRLDFTVIGAAVNVASRLEGLTKKVRRSVLFSEAFVKLAGCHEALERLGDHHLRGLDGPIGVFALQY